MSDSDSFEEYWAIIRPIRHLSPTKIQPLNHSLEQNGVEFLVSLLDDQGREQTPRTKIGALMGTCTFPSVTGTTHIAWMALWDPQLPEVPIRQVPLELGGNLSAGDTPIVNYRIEF
jgi:hypothetical protein